MLACCLVVNSVDLVVSFTGMVWVLCFMMGMVVVDVVDLVWVWVVVTGL